VGKKRSTEKKSKVPEWVHNSGETKEKGKVVPQGTLKNEKKSKREGKKVRKKKKLGGNLSSPA